MSNLKILVVGASIAGPTAAYWLAKAGAEVTVIERFPALRANGQNVDIRNAGVTVMRKMPGMEAAVKAKTVPMDGISFVHENGRPFATMTATGDSDHQSLVSEYEIYRGDLAQILFNMTKDNDKIKYIFDEQVKSIDQTDDDSVMVTFKNRLPATRYDLVVACDGATSRTRAIGLGCGVRDHIRTLNAWTAYFSIEQDLLAGSRLAQSFSTTGGRFFGVGPDPSGTNRVALMGIFPKKDTDAMRPFHEAVKQGEVALKDYVYRHFKGAGWKTEDILDGMLKAKDFYASEVVQVKVPHVYQGRFVMVGDAGYGAGPIGTGTSLAMAGAYVLAGEVSKHHSNLPAALKAYEERMKPIIQDLQKIPPGVPGLLAPQTRWQIRLRNLFLILFAWATTVGKAFSWVGYLFASSFGPDNNGIPDYEWPN